MGNLPAAMIRQLTWLHLLGLFLLLVTPIVFAPFISDDFFHLLMLGDTPPLPHPNDGSLYGLFSFISNDAAYRRLLIDQGALPWWTGDSFYFRFWRPLAEITHRVDYTLAPKQPIFAHLHSIAWFVALALVVQKLFQRVAVSSSMAWLAVIVFVLNGNHAPTIEWIANRNALLAAFFAFASLYCHSRFRDQGFYRDYLLAVLCLVAGLLSGESAVAVGGFFFAYALFVDKSGLVRGLCWMLPYALVVMVWFVIYRQLGFGADGSGMHYVDAASQPLAFLRAVAERLPVYLFAGFNVLPAELYPALQLVSRPLATGMFVLVLLVLLLLATALWPLLKSDSSVRFFLLGALLSIIPFCSLVNQDRLLLIPSVGFSFVIAAVIHKILLQQLVLSHSRLLQAGIKVLAILFVWLHLIISPVYLFAASWYIHDDALSTQQALKHLPDSAMQADNLLIFKGPLVHSALLKPVRQLADKSYPEHVLLLSAPSGRLEVERVAENRLLLRRNIGFVAQFEQSFRDLQREPFVLGDQLKASMALLTVREVNDRGQPVLVECELLAPLTSYRFLVYHRSGKPQSVELPALGESVIW